MQLVGALGDALSIEPPPLESNMKSFQDRLMEQFEAIANDEDCELIVQSSWGNAGQLLAQPNGTFETVAYLSYQISQRQSVIEFNGNDLSPRDTSALFATTDTAKIHAMLDKWRQLVADGVKAGKPVEEGIHR